MGRCRSRRRSALGRKPGDVADVAEQPGGSGRTDPVEPHQPAAGLGDRRGQLLLGGLDAGVDDLQLVDQLARQLPAGLADHGSPAATSASRARACRAVRAFFAPPGTSSTSSRCSRLIVRVRAAPSSSRRSASSRNATVRSSRPTWRNDRVRSPTTATAWRRLRRSCGPARSRTPGPARRAWPARPPRSRRRRPAAAPDVGRPPGSPRPPTPAAGTAGPPPAATGSLAVGAEPPAHQRLFVVVEYLDHRGSLMRVHPDHDPAHQHAPSPRRNPAIDGGGQRYLEPVSPLWSHSSSRCPTRRTPS